MGIENIDKLGTKDEPTITNPPLTLTTRAYRSAPERMLLGLLCKLLKPPVRLSIIEWAQTYRTLSSEESFFDGKFDCTRTPALEYIYDCLQNRHIYIIVAMKASQIGWSELTNNYIGWLIHTRPCKIQWAFPGREPSRIYSREKLKPFFDNTRELADLISSQTAKESFNYFKFPGGWLKLTTLGAIGNAKTSSVPIIGVEEPDDVKDEVKGQGDTLENVKGRQKTFPIGFKKLLFGGTPTDKDFSRVDAGYKQSNQLVFKAQCHNCLELVELSLDNLKYNDYQDRYIDETFGRSNPATAYYECELCKTIWTEKDKVNNILAGKKFGFTDFTGNFSKGWHPKRPDVIETFGFHIPELISGLSSSTFIDLASKRILAEQALLRGNESLMKSFVNNSKGLPFASGVTSMEAEEMKKLRKNYPEHIVPMEGLILTAGVDVQDNRLAYVIRAWGRNNNSWLVTWEEIWGDVRVQEKDAQGNYVGVWGELTNRVLKADIPHAGGKTLRVSALSIDSSDNSSLVYNWVLDMQEINPQVFATKGVKELRYSDDEIYREPIRFDVDTDKQIRKSVAETMGVTVYNLGTHKAHMEILNRVLLNTREKVNSFVYYFNEQSYGQYEEQMTSCRKLVDTRHNGNKEVFKLISGKRKEAMDAEKNCLHASLAIGIRNYTQEYFSAIETYLYSD